MLMLILIIYITIGVVSTFTHLGKWIFSSMIWAVPLLPFMIIYFLVFGDSQKKSEAIFLLKFIAVLAGLYLFLVLLFSAF
ncbi:MAG: hypothetical protein EOM06_12400 [Sphingobacteriia bacterium]|nr:hypothetical protein [Sphingobacteriia bacterium]